jgi:hypothetical protein
MPALSGQVIMTLTKAGGVVAVVVTWFFDPTTLALRNNPIAWTDPTAVVWPIGSGALIAVNQVGKAVKVRINDAGGTLIRRVNLPTGGRAVTAAQLASAAPPDGPYTTATDLNGLTFDLS